MKQGLGEGEDNVGIVLMGVGGGGLKESEEAYHMISGINSCMSNLYGV